MKVKVSNEIIRLHKFFEDWFLGKIPNTSEEFDTFKNAFSPSFHMITPDGIKSHGSVVVNSIEGLYNYRKNDPTFKIWIENITLYKYEGDMVLASYEEHQKIDGEKTTRISSVIFKINDSKEYPLLWFHLHETWIAE